MKETRKFALLTLIITLLAAALFVGGVYLLAGDALRDRALALFGAGAAMSVVLAVALQWLANRMLASQAVSSQATPVSTAPAPRPAEAPKPSSASAIQILALLQRKGRLIDFLQEDLSSYDDARIGAAVRSIHEGCRQALSECMSLEPVYKVEQEGSEITVEAGFDADLVRLIGDAVGDPPFRGVLRHRGWRVARFDLPERTRKSPEEAMVLAAAEVEVGA